MDAGCGPGGRLQFQSTIEQRPIRLMRELDPFFLTTRCTIPQFHPWRRWCIPIRKRELGAPHVVVGQFVG